MKSTPTISDSKNKKDTSKEVDTKIKNIKKRILQFDKEYHQAGATQTESFIIIGKQFHILKKLLKSTDEYNEINFEDYCDKNFPLIKERKRQRCMKLSKSLDLKEHPDLKYIPITKLETLATNRRDRSIGELLIEKFGFTDLQQLSDEPTTKQISDFKRDVDVVLTQCNGGWNEDEQTEPYRKRSSLEKQKITNVKRSIESRKTREIKKRGFVDFVQLETEVNRCLKILTKHLNQFLNNGGNFYNRKTNKQEENDPILNINSQDLKDFVKIFRKILKNNRVKANDSDISDYYGDQFDKAIENSDFWKQLQNDV